MSFKMSPRLTYSPSLLHGLALPDPKHHAYCYLEAKLSGLTEIDMPPVAPSRRFFRPSGLNECARIDLAELLNLLLNMREFG